MKDADKRSNRELFDFATDDANSRPARIAAQNELFPARALRERQRSGTGTFTRGPSGNGNDEELTMLSGKIEFTGKTLSDVRYAVEEALRSIVDGENTSGFNHNDSGSFNFDVEGEEEEETADEDEPS